VNKPIVGAVAHALAARLEASASTSGAIFRRIRGSKAAEPLAGHALWLTVKPRAKLAGLEGRATACQGSPGGARLTSRCLSYNPQ
jgi:hypothetical protein